MTNQEIFDLIACFDRSGLTSLRLTRQDVTIEMTKGGAAIPAAPAAPAPAVSASAAAPDSDAARLLFSESDRCSRSASA